MIFFPLSRSFIADVHGSLVNNGTFCFPVGMFSALTNLGAGGLQDVALSDTANSVLYAFFALTGTL